ncbi:MAG: ADP-ribosylglycohydrolase family protein [Clostridia bacterium]|nr:ADP-ribosylglycohydrolase family protein [Clostridia bacterium]
MTQNSTIRLNRAEYRDKVYACWTGKNIGGTMGAPYEGVRHTLDIKGFATEANTVLPNDDLDLQLVWLHALEKIGPQNINAQTLGEFWLSFISPYWHEYGIAKTNMKKGLIPPLAGDYHNDWRHSNGAWIRTEIWASIAPGCPDIAAKYAIEDAKVDHGAGEGTYAAAFVAAMQSAAFVLPDLRKCIDIGLARIPKDCRIADSIRTVLDCYDKGIAPMEARDIIFERNKDIGVAWFEAPSNVSYAIIGLLYGEGDFKKSMITAINCGDDTDCTAATVGSTLGILGGTAAIPEDWRAHIGDDIVTIAIARGGVCRNLPESCTVLTDRLIVQTPYVLLSNNAHTEITEGSSFIPENLEDVLSPDKHYKRNVLDVLRPYAMQFDFNFVSVYFYFEKCPDIKPGEEIKVNVLMRNNIHAYENMYHSMSMRWWLPDGFSVDCSSQTITLPSWNPHVDGACGFSFTIKAGDKVEPINRCVLELTATDRMTPMYAPITLLG